LLLYQRAYSIAPHDNLICTNLGTALLDTGYPDAAIALYTKVLAREPRYWLSNYDLGYAYYKLGKPEAAEPYLLRALSVNDQDSDTLICLGLCIWRQGRADEAIPYMQRAIQARPSAPGYHFALAMVLRGQNNSAAAEYEFNQELKYNPENVAARQQLEALTSGAAAPSK
jgi:tetratricopeptide (TPR) repeat protein